MLRILDSNIVSLIVRERGTWLKERLQKVSGEGLAISVVTEAEILFGIENHPQSIQRNQNLRDLLTGIPKLSFTSETAAAYASLRHRLRKAGVGAGDDLDLMIAAHAYEHHCILVTNDGALQNVAPWVQVEAWTS